MTQWWACFEAMDSEPVIRATAASGEFPFADGDPTFVAIIPIERDPVATERVDPVTGAIADCPIKAHAGAMRAVLADMPSEAQLRVYAAKLAEAEAFEAGQPAGPYITAEAAATDTDIADLAAAIIARAAERNAQWTEARAWQEANRRRVKSVNKGGRYGR